MSLKNIFGNLFKETYTDRKRKEEEENEYETILIRDIPRSSDGNFYATERDVKRVKRR